MVSPGKFSQFNLPSAIQQRILVHFQAGWEERLNVDQMFVLISGVLPLEACLYYQVLPLFLDGNRLHLGMVTLNDTTALEYVRRIVSYLNYSLVPHAISYDALQVALTAYLNYTGDRSSPTPSIHQSADATPLERDSDRSHRHPAPSHRKPLQPDTCPTLVLDSSENSSTSPMPGLPPLIASIPSLLIQARHLTDPVEVLMTLPPPMMLQELLARLLIAGIGRLYFECHLQYGRVLWSQDGILQSVLESLPLPVFHQLLQELKAFAQASLAPPPQQIEIERIYDRSRVLLRLRFMAGQYGEEATLQVLRGAALRFHQKQQLASLKRDALSIAKQLQTKLNEIRDRAYTEPGLAAARFEALPSLNQLLQTIEDQLNELEQEA
jgi:hypothetical protein